MTLLIVACVSDAVWESFTNDPSDMSYSFHCAGGALPFCQHLIGRKLVLSIAIILVKVTLTILSMREVRHKLQ